jgi:hypothetical protein
MSQLRHLVVRAARPRFSGSFLPYPLRVATAALALTMLLGCTSAASRNANAVARSQNDYDFTEAKYEDSCRVPAPPASCVKAKAALDVWLTDLHRKAFIDWDNKPKPTIPRTGPTPLHDAALVADEKAAKKVKP